MEATLDELSAMTLEAQRWRLLAANPHATRWKDFYIKLAEAYEDAAKLEALEPSAAHLHLG